MAFTVEDLQDLLRLIDVHPEWRAELRRHVLGGDLIELPAILRRIADVQEQTARHLATLAVRMDALAEAEARTEQGLATLAVRVDALTEAIRALADAQGDMRGEFRGALLELRYRGRPGSYLGRLIRRPHLLSDEELDTLLEAAEARGELDEGQSADIIRADAVVRGRRRVDGQEVYLVVEISWGVGTSDVARALRRAELLARTGLTTVAVVAGGRITRDADDLAAAVNVERVTGELDFDESGADGAA